MALDIALLDDSGQPIEFVPVGVDTHRQLVEFARRENLELLLRLSDHYEEASFFRQELDALGRELQAVVGSTAAAPELVECVRQVIDLCRRARGAERGLQAIPD